MNIEVAGKNKVLKVIAVGSVILGFVIAGYELWHTVRGAHELRLTPFWAAGVFILLGAAVFQYGDVKAALELAYRALEIIGDRIPGGRRKTDPPPPQPPADVNKLSNDDL